jgi:hypothetical protein
MAGLVLLLTSLHAASVLGQSSRYPPLSEYTMTPDAEVSLAKSAVPASVSAHAMVKILTVSGFRVAAEGDNGFVCIVLRGWGAPTRHWTDRMSDRSFLRRMTALRSTIYIYALTEKHRKLISGLESFTKFRTELKASNLEHQPVTSDLGLVASSYDLL